MNDISNRTNVLLLNDVLQLYVVFMKSMDINSWQHSFDSQHFAQFVPNLFGKPTRIFSLFHQNTVTHKTHSLSQSWAWKLKKNTCHKNEIYQNILFRGIFRTQGYQCQGKTIHYILLVNHNHICLRRFTISLCFCCVLSKISRKKRTTAAICILFCCFRVMHDSCSLGLWFLFQYSIVFFSFSSLYMCDT